MCEVHGVDNCKAPCCQIHPIGCVCVECEEKAMREDVVRRLKEEGIKPNPTLDEHSKTIPLVVGQMLFDCLRKYKDDERLTVNERDDIEYVLCESQVTTAVSFWIDWNKVSIQQVLNLCVRQLDKKEMEVNG